MGIFSKQACFGESRSTIGNSLAYMRLPDCVSSFKQGNIQQETRRTCRCSSSPPRGRRDQIFRLYF